MCRCCYVWGVDSLEFFRWWRFCSGSSAVVAVVVVGFVVAGLFFANCRGVGEERSGGFRFGGAHHKPIVSGSGPSRGFQISIHVVLVI